MTFRTACFGVCMMLCVALIVVGVFQWGTELTGVFILESRALTMIFIGGLLLFPVGILAAWNELRPPIARGVRVRIVAIFEVRKDFPYAIEVVFADGPLQGVNTRISASDLEDPRNYIYLGAGDVLVRTARGFAVSQYRSQIPPAASAAS